MSVSYRLRCTHEGSKARIVSVDNATAVQVAELVRDLEAEGITVDLEVVVDRSPNPPIEYRQ